MMMQVHVYRTCTLEEMLYDMSFSAVCLRKTHHFFKIGRQKFELSQYFFKYIVIYCQIILF